MSKRSVAVLIVIVAFVVAAAVLVVAERADLLSSSSARTAHADTGDAADAISAADSHLAATVFRRIAEARTPAVVSIRTEVPRETTELTDFDDGLEM